MTAVDTPLCASREAKVFRRSWNFSPGVLMASRILSHLFGLNLSLRGIKGGELKVSGTFSSSIGDYGLRCNGGMTSLACRTGNPATAENAVRCRGSGEFRRDD